MSAERKVSYELHQRAAAGELENLLGYRAYFQHKDNDAVGVKPVLSEMVVEAVWVRNETGGQLTEGTICEWDTGTTYGPGRAVKTVAGDEEAGAGVVGPGRTVEGDEHFWLIRKGPCKFQYDGSANIAVNDPLATAASGDVKEFVLGTDPFHAFAGRALEAISSGDAGDLFKGYADFQF